MAITEKKSSSAFTAYLSELISAVCPIHGISLGSGFNKKTIRIDFKPEATQEQIDAANALVTSYNWEKKVAKSKDVLTTAVNALQDQGRDKLITKLIVQALQKDSAFATDENIDLPGFETVVAVPE